jgi:hypothetical protein
MPTKTVGYKQKNEYASGCEFGIIYQSAHLTISKVGS